MSNFSDFFPAAGGGGLTPKFEEFNSSGTFTPTQALIDAGGYIELFLVGGGGRSNSTSAGACGGETIFSRMYLTSTTGCAVTIGAGGASNGTDGGSSSFVGSSAGGSDVTALGGSSNAIQTGRMGAGFGAVNDGTAGSGVFGYGVGGGENGDKGIYAAKTNSGQGGSANATAGSGYLLIKYYE